MEDISITLVKNNKYYIKTPFKCEVIKLLVENNEDLSEIVANNHIEISVDISNVEEELIDEMFSRFCLGK